MFLPVIEDEDKVFTLRYKDTLSFTAPWKFWKTLGKPSEMMIKSLQKDGMYLLEIIE